VHGSYDPPGRRLLDVVAVMDRLRSPGGCPWDAEQTHTSLMPYLLEEAYEAYAALEDGDLVDLREELGDVLLQVVFHARLAEEADRPWSIDDVAGDLVDKLVRRHPHVFAGTSADDLEGTWEALKKAEKGRTSVTDGVPLSQPALALAAKLQGRAARLGAPVPAFDGLGGELWELVRRCRAAGLDPELALRTTARAYRDRLAAAEAAVLAAGSSPRRWHRRSGSSRGHDAARHRGPPAGAALAAQARSGATRVYDPAPLLEVEALEVGRGASVGQTPDGPVLDVHHADHPTPATAGSPTACRCCPRATTTRCGRATARTSPTGSPARACCSTPTARGPSPTSAGRCGWRRPRASCSSSPAWPRRRRAWSSAASACGCRPVRSAPTCGRRSSTSTAAPAGSTPRSRTAGSSAAHGSAR
jgi:XTP/dITP diphosphohydrolase